MTGPSIEDLIIFGLVCCALPIILFASWLFITVYIAVRKKYPRTIKLLLIVGITMIYISTPVSIAGFGYYLKTVNNDNFNLEPGKEKEYNRELEKGDTIEVRFTSNNPVEIVKIVEIFEIRNHSKDKGYPIIQGFDYIPDDLKVVSMNSTGGSLKYTIPANGNYSVIFYNSFEFGIGYAICKVKSEVVFHDKSFERQLMVGLIVLTVGIILIITGIFKVRKYKDKVQRDIFFIHKNRQ